MSDETIDLLTKQLTPCRFPKRYLLIREGVYHKYAYFIEKGITRSYWLVDGKEVTTSFRVKEISCSAWMSYTTVNPVKSLWKHWKMYCSMPSPSRH